MLILPVTLIGAHSLGHMHIANSGYGFIDPSNGPTLLNAWDATPAVLDNGFYIELTRNVSDVFAIYGFPSLVLYISLFFYDKLIGF